MNSKLTFYEGEKREVTAIINSINSDERVVIASSNYELTAIYDNSVAQRGECEIRDNEVTVYLDLNLKGDYELKITSQVGREVIISKQLITIK